MEPLAGKVAVVSARAHGLGCPICETKAKAGATVAAVNFPKEIPLGLKNCEVNECVPFGLISDPSESVESCIFLVSNAARYIVARTLNVNGGNWVN